MKPTIKKSAIKFATGLTLLTFIVGTVGALNGWFGGGGKIPEDTFTRGLVAYWSFDEGSGNIAYDASGKGNHGTIYGAKWSQGKTGSGLSFDGVDDYVNAGEGGGTLDFGTGDFSIEFWINYKGTTIINREPGGIVCKTASMTNSPGFCVEITTYGGDGTNYGIIFTTTNGAWGTGNLELQGAFLPNIWYHVVGVRRGSTWTIYKNGAYAISETKAGIGVNVDNDQNLLIGYRPGVYLNGLIDEVRIYNRALSPEEIRFHYSRGGPVAYWKFDEGQGTKVYDLSGNGNNGTLNLGTSGNTDPSKAWAPGKFGTALSFDGVDDYVRIENINQLAGSKEATFEYWVKYINPTDYDLCGYIDSSNHAIRLGRSDTGTIFVNAGEHADVNTGVALETNTWIHLALTMKVGDKWIVYKNGKAVYSSTTGLPSTSFYQIPYFGIGASIESPGPVHFVGGLIDEVRIYNYARTPDEIRLDYNAGYAARFGPSTDCNSDPGSCMTKGLVGYWSFDEGSGNIAYDASGNGNHGTIYGAKWSQGALAPSKSGAFGTGLSFDGVDDYVEVPDSASLDITKEVTVEAWIYPRKLDVYGGGISKGDSQLFWKNNYYLEIGYGGFRWGGGDGTNEVIVWSSSKAKNQWYHVVGVMRDNELPKLYVNGIYDVSGSSGTGVTLTTNNINLFIGKASSYYSNAIIDEVRIYNRALSENEIRYHYNHTLPKGALSPLAMKEDPSLVGYWSFNEGNGTIIYDQSGNNNNGKLYLGSSGNTDPSKAWSPGISGTALSFDGVDDYVEVPDNPSLDMTDEVTITAWIKPKSLTNSYRVILVKGYDPYNNYGLWYERVSPDRLTVHFEWRVGGTFYSVEHFSLPLNEWSFVAAVFNKGTVQVWKNSEVYEQSGFPTSLEPNNYSLITSWRPYGQNLNAIIDEVRIYNRALSEQEILEHYRNSKYYLASHFGPKTNCREDPGSCIDYGLVGYWSFDEGAGTTAYDASGKGNNGKIYGAKWVPGKFGQALSFDGADDYVEVPYNPIFNSNSFTVMIWIKRPSPVTTESVFLNKYGTTTVTPYWDMRFRVGGYWAAQYRDVNGNERRIEVDINVQDNKWHHLVFGREYGVKFFTYTDGKATMTLSDDVGSIANDRGIYLSRILNFYVSFYADEVRI